MALPSGPAHAQDEQPLVLEPASNWVLDYGEDYCAIRRNFGADDAGVFLEFRQFAIGRRFQVLISTDDWDRRRGNIRTGFAPSDSLLLRDQIATVVRANGEEGFIYHDTAMRAEDYPEIIGTGRPYRPAYIESQITSYRVHDAFDVDLELKVGPLDEVFEVMDLCVRDYLTSIGVDLDKERNQQTSARPVQLSRWARDIQRKYPRNLLRTGKDGRVVLQLLVEADGRVSQCRTVEPVVDPEYEEWVCGEVLDEARYDPAIDAQGEPFRSSVSLTIVYETR